MTLPVALPSSGNTNWYSHYSALHDACNGGNYHAIVVASDDAPDAVKQLADYVCDGTADDVQINAAIEVASPTQANDAGQGGTDRAVAGGQQRGHVILTGGEFKCSNSILLRTGVWLQGSGPLTFVREINITASTGSGTPTALVKNYDTYTHLTAISDMTLYGNLGSGGPGHGIYLESGSDLDSYPNTDPDSYARIERMFIHYFSNTAGRNGIHIAGAPNGRGIFIDNCAIRNHDNAGIYIDAPDGCVQNCNIGGGEYGVVAAGGNYRFTNIKAWYADTAGFRFENTRTVATCLEAQDNAIGAQITAGTQIIEGLHIDNCSSIGIDIASSVNTLKLSFLMHQRSGGRYTTMTQGIDFNSGGVRQHIDGVIDATDITTPVSGTTAGSGNFMRISHGTTLVSVG